MADNTDERAKGTPRSNDPVTPKRPHATIDLKATEIDTSGAGDEMRAADSEMNAPGTSSTGLGAGADAKSADNPDAGDAERPSDSDRGADDAAIAGPPPPGARASSGWLVTHLGAGAVGALLVLLASQLMPAANSPAASDLARRVGDLEASLGLKPDAPGLRGKVDELSRTLGTLNETQAGLARDTKALQTKGQEGARDLTARIAKLEDAFKALASGAQAGQPPQITALMGRLTEAERATSDAAEAAKQRAGRVDGELASLRTEAGRVSQRIDSLKGEVDERLKQTAKAAELPPLATKLGALEQNLKGLAKSEADRDANASRIVLALELANLRRAMDRGEGYVDELAAVRKVGGYTINLAPLERYSREGVPTAQELARSFRKVANAMMDADAEPANAGIMDRLLSGARSIVRVRKAGHAPDDNSVEAIVGRMEIALKAGRLDEVTASAKNLPAKSALAGEDWLRKVAARQAVEQALADAEASLKTSIGAARAGATEPKK